MSTLSLKRSARYFIAAGLLLPTMAFPNHLNAKELNKVDEVLAAEASGKPINRREALSQETDQISQWQAGRILIDGQWLAIEDLQGHKLAAQAAAYKNQRDSKELDVEGHRRMARWCQSHQLPEMASVHWKAVIATAVDDEQARKALGHKRVGRDWFSEEELKQASDDQKQAKASLKQWMPIVRKIVINLQSRDTAHVLEATRELEKIDSPAAVNALKYAAMQVEPTVAIPIVSKIESIRSKDSCLALCEIALIDPNNEVGRLAVQGLKNYDEHFYVPELLQILEVPIQLKQQCVYLPNGSLAIQQAFTRETADTKEQIEILKLVTIADSAMFYAASPFAPLSTTVITDGPTASTQTVTSTVAPKASAAVTVQALNPVAAQSAQKLSSIDQRNKSRFAETANSIQSQREKNAKAILSTISGLPSDQPTETYWNWWPAFNESATNEKATIKRSYVDASQPVNLTTSASGTLTVSLGQTTTTSVVPRHHNCLVAGTLIQTSEGLKNVEEIKIGDFITSMNVETGEIALRPATHVTVRNAESTYLINIGEETIRATGGHNWWVVGRGWVRSRDLTAGQYMRTGDSSVEITKVEKIDAPINVYNMIVDQNHTYFVGKDRLLSWDVTSLKPTLQTAPGQTKSMYVTKK